MQNTTNERMTGEGITKLMRENKVTIRELAARMDITHKRVRFVRAHGVSGENVVRDWLEAIEGGDQLKRTREETQKRVAEIIEECKAVHELERNKSYGVVNSIDCEECPALCGFSYLAEGPSE